MYRKKRKYTFLIRICFLLLLLSLGDVDVRATITTVQQTVQQAILHAAAVGDELSEQQNSPLAAKEPTSIENGQPAQLVADLGIGHLFRTGDGSFRFRTDPSFFDNERKQVSE